MALTVKLFKMMINKPQIQLLRIRFKISSKNLMKYCKPRNVSTILGMQSKTYHIMTKLRKVVKMDGQLLPVC